MTAISKTHHFHIPVMGLAFTIDSPLRVAQYGIDSVISIMDDDLIEKVRGFYSEKFKQPYESISTKIEDYRAKRITSYLNFLDQHIATKFEHFKEDLASNQKELESFLQTLPSSSTLKSKLEEVIHEKKLDFQGLKEILNRYLYPGSIDVNIMTKVDKDNFKDSEPLSGEYNDAHAALRGFALSTTRSSVIFSAGMNPRLYSYMENFDVFYPNLEGDFQKKIVLKVSDFRSAMVQGQFLAKKGLWVSEYRIESGLNCGGHAFATQGLLMGPILEEFRSKKRELIESAFALLAPALEQKGKTVPTVLPSLAITVQGGVGTGTEHAFLRDHYQVDSVGWGSPFLLVPEATSVDKETRELLAKAKEEDLYLSDISPLGVPFNTIRGTSNEYFKNKRIQENKAGSSCPKKYLALSKAYGETEGICTASKKYQDRRLEELEEKKAQLDVREYQEERVSITEKACLCVGLANSAQLELGIPVKGQKQGVVVCPGPNIAYFSKEVSLKEMMRHIYGGPSVENHENRPHVFIKELDEYLKYFRSEIEKTKVVSPALEKKWKAFKENLLSGIDYYKSLFEKTPYFSSLKKKLFVELEQSKAQIESIRFTKTAPVES
ncbi:hypothetical protein ACX3PU_04305 [Chryseobacterium sp. A301]